MKILGRIAESNTSLGIPISTARNQCLFRKIDFFLKFNSDIKFEIFFWIPEALFFSRLWLEFCCKFWGLATFQRNDQKPKFLSRFRHFLLWKNSIGGLNWSNSAFSTRKLRSKGQDGSDCSSWDSGGSVVWTREDQRKPGYYVNNPNFSKFLHTKWR